MYRYLIAGTLALGALTASPAFAVQPVAAASASVGQLKAQEVVQHYSTLVYANYSDTLTAAKQMQKAIHAFLAKPSQATQDAARKAWLDAREFYGQTEAFRFYDGPIDSEDGPEGQMNAWPMDESYVDYVEGDDKAGLINNRKVVISKKKLAELNEHDGEENISTGWHAIEFMLWGQDLSETGPGARPFTDFIDGKKSNADRRRAYLKAVTELLIDDLQSVTNEWKPAAKNNFRAKFSQGGEESLRKIFVGLGSLSRGELAGERLEVAMASRDQEDEHSCFSDNTHRDAVTNAQGIQNVWLGSYKRMDGTELKGPGLRDWVAAHDATVAEKTSLQIAKSVASAQSIPAPFDQAIQGARDSAARATIQNTIDSLTQQSKDLVDAAKAVGIEQLNLVEP
jgi:putative iron-regulated protein